MQSPIKAAEPRRHFLGRAVSVLSADQHILTVAAAGRTQTSGWTSAASPMLVTAVFIGTVKSFAPSYTPRLLMARYLKKFTSIGSAGPTEERGFAIWAGYDIVGVDDDLSSHGLLKADHWTSDEIAVRGITTFLRVEPDDDATYAKLGIERKS